MFCVCYVLGVCSVLFLYSALAGDQGIVISLSVCVSVSPQAYLVVIRYVLPVSWMTSRLAMMGHIVMRGRLNL